ncbi:MAG: PhoH family protein [Saprospiraceae bacterium]|nr:PhoH family protein [Saprospiraceae bacterium]
MTSLHFTFLKILGNSLSEIVLTLDGIDPVDLFGRNNVRLNLLKEAYPEVNFASRGNTLKLAGNKRDTQRAKSKFELMVRMLKKDKELSTDTVINLLNGDPSQFDAIFDNKTVIVHGRTGKPIRARTLNQKRLVEAVGKNDIVFAVGPAGTGKTYTAVALAVRALKNKQVKKIILTRPAVEAGESLGFLPGDLKEKVDPYLRPLYDALDDMIPFDKLTHFMTNRTIEVAPLAFMRGRTLDHAFIILDEAQNATSTQLKMFLTRLGPSAKCIVNGDLSQIDLPRSVRSGLRTSIDILSGLKGIATIRLTADDVVRHRLVKEIIHAYDKRGKASREEE